MSRYPSLSELPQLQRAKPRRILLWCSTSTRQSSTATATTGSSMSLVSPNSSAAFSPPCPGILSWFVVPRRSSFFALLPNYRFWFRVSLCGSRQDRVMAELHSRGRSVEEIAECLRRAPLDPHVAQAIRAAYALGCELRVVSDANLFFIETVLRHHGLLECFTEINTNPSFVDEEGRLRIRPYHDFTQSSHGCSLCPPNMCKGKIIDQIRASVLREGKRQFIYLGDGQGDFCPSLRLCDGDYVMPRKNYPLWNLIRENPRPLKALLHEWSNGEELQAVLLQLINQPMDADRISPNQRLSVDCKHEELTISSTEGLPLPLRVPH